MSCGLLRLFCAARVLECLLYKINMRQSIFRIISTVIDLVFIELIARANNDLVVI
jgi:hypothetical protein